MLDEGLLAVWRHDITLHTDQQRRHDRSRYCVSFVRKPYQDRVWPSQGSLWARTAADAEAVYRNTRDMIISSASDRTPHEL